MILRRRMTNSQVRSDASARKVARLARALRKVSCTSSSAVSASETRLRAKRYSSSPNRAGHSAGTGGTELMRGNDWANWAAAQYYAPLRKQLLFNVFSGTSD